MTSEYSKAKKKREKHTHKERKKDGEEVFGDDNDDHGVDDDANNGKG